MKGSALVLLGCFALFFAAPSRSYAISEDDQLANRRDTRSGSPSTDAATSGDAVENTDTSPGESKTIEMIGDANPGNESVAGDAQVETSKIRKRDTRSLVRDETEDTKDSEYAGYDDEATGMPPISKEEALTLFKQLGKFGGRCLEQAFKYIEVNALPIGFVEEWSPEDVFTWADMIKWLRILKDTVPECLADYVELQSEHALRVYDAPPVELHSDSDSFDTVAQILSPLMDIGKMLKKCFEDAIRNLAPRPYVPADTVKRSSESLSDLLAELIGIHSMIEGTVFPAGDTVPMSPPSQTVPPYPNSVPVATAYKKRNSLGKQRGIPHYIYSEDRSNSMVPQFSRFGGEAAQIPYTPEITTLPEDVSAHLTQQLSLLDVVLGKIYSKLQGKDTQAVNVETAPVEGLRVDADGALGVYPGNGESSATQQLSLLNIVLDKIYAKLQGKDTQAVNTETAPVEDLRVDANGALGVCPGNGECPATQQLSLLNKVLDKIYAKLQGKVLQAVNTETAPVEGLRVDAHGALGLYPGNGESPATGNLIINPDCVQKRVQ